MKTAKPLPALAAILLSWGASAVPHAQVISPRSDNFKAKTDSLHRSLSVRGGDLGPVSGQTIAKTMSVLASGDALFGTIRPVEAWKKFGVTIEPGSIGEHYLGHGIASSASCLAITGFLATSSKTSIEHAIAYGLLARCAFMAEMLLTDKCKELGMPTAPFLTIWLVLLSTSFNLLSGQYEPLIMARIVSVTLAGHGALLVLRKIDKDDKDSARMANFDGGYMFISSLFLALLSFGVDPVKAMGAVAVCCIPIFYCFLGLLSEDTLFGVDVTIWKVIFVSFIAAMAYGMLN